MLKRYQVILEDWLAEHIKKMSELYDLSFSETTRAALCLAYIELISQAYPKFKPAISKDRTKKAIRDRNYERMGRDQFHKSLSQLYFEARKAIDFYWGSEIKHKRGGRA
jgi:hypothetical protein